MPVQYLADTNVVYYTLGLEKNNGFTYSFDRLPVGTWHITDLNILESYNRYGDHRNPTGTLASFYKEHSGKMVRMLNSDEDVLRILDAEFDSKAYRKSLARLCVLKKDLEVQALKFSADLFVICNIQRRILDGKPQDKEDAIWRAIAAQVLANDVFLKELIRQHLEAFYKDGKESTFKTKMQKVMLMSLHVSEWVLLSVKKNVSLSGLFSGLTDGTISANNDPCPAAIGKFAGLLNSETKRQGKWTPIDSSLIQSLDLLEDVTKHYSEIPLGFMKYLKELTLRVLSVGKKIHKNDMIDALFMKKYPNYAIITEDVSFRKMIRTMDPRLYKKGRDGMLKMRTSLPK